MLSYVDRFLVGNLLQSVCKHAVLYLSVIAQRLTSVAVKVDQLNRRRSSSNWSQNRISLFLNSNFFRWLKIQTSAACMMCTVTMSMDRTERPSCLLQLKSASPTVIAKTGSLGPGFYLQRARERRTH